MRVAVRSAVPIARFAIALAVASSAAGAQSAPDQVFTGGKIFRNLAHLLVLILTVNKSDEITKIYLTFYQIIPTN